MNREIESALERIGDWEDEGSIVLVEDNNANDDPQAKHQRRKSYTNLSQLHDAFRDLDYPQIEGEVARLLGGLSAADIKAAGAAAGMTLTGSKSAMIADVTRRIKESKGNWERNQYFDRNRKSAPAQFRKWCKRWTSKKYAGHDYSSTQFNLEGAALEYVQNLQRQVDAADLHSKGMEDIPHVTVRYGLEDSDAGPVCELVEMFGTVSAELGKVNYFAGDEYDVLIIEVESDDLHEMNDALAELPHVDTHPVYRPHVTLAYLKPGTAEQYTDLGQQWDDEQPLQFTQLVFSPRDGTPVAVDVASYEWQETTGASSLDDPRAAAARKSLVRKSAQQDYDGLKRTIGTVSIDDIRAVMPGMSKYSKEEIKEVLTSLGYTSSGSKSGDIKRLLDNLISLKISHSQNQQIKRHKANKSIVTKDKDQPRADDGKFGSGGGGASGSNATANTSTDVHGAVSDISKEVDADPKAKAHSAGVFKRCSAKLKLAVTNKLTELSTKACDQFIMENIMNLQSGTAGSVLLAKAAAAGAAKAWLALRKSTGKALDQDDAEQLLAVLTVLAEEAGWEVPAVEDVQAMLDEQHS